MFQLVVKVAAPDVKTLQLERKARVDELAKRVDNGQINRRRLRIDRIDWRAVYLE